MRPSGRICIFCSRVDGLTSAQWWSFLPPRRFRKRLPPQPNNQRSIAKTTTHRNQDLITDAGVQQSQNSIAGTTTRQIQNSLQRPQPARAGTPSRRPQPTRPGISRRRGDKCQRAERLVVTPVDLVQLALLPNQVDARSRAAALAAPSVKKFLELSGGAPNDLFSHLLVGLTIERSRELSFSNSAFQQTIRDNGMEEKKSEPQQQSRITQPLTLEEIARRLQLASTIDDILVVAGTASQTAHGRSMFMSLYHLLYMAIERTIHDDRSGRGGLAAFNAVTSVLLKHGADLDSRYCELGLKYATWTGSLPAMKAMKLYMNAYRDPHPQMPAFTWLWIVEWIVKFANFEAKVADPEIPAVWEGGDAWRAFEAWKNSKAWKRREALHLITGWETAGVGGLGEARGVSLESFLDRRKIRTYAYYILALGKLGASEAIWQEWLISRDRVFEIEGTKTILDTGEDAKGIWINPIVVPDDARPSEQLLLHFLQALMAANDTWRTWQLIAEVKAHKPALLSTHLWGSLLGLYHPNLPSPNLLSQPQHRTSLLTQAASHALRSGGGLLSIHALAREVIRCRGKLDGSLGASEGLQDWRSSWKAWDLGMRELAGKSEMYWVRRLEKLFGLQWYHTGGGCGYHLVTRKSRQSRRRREEAVVLAARATPWAQVKSRRGHQMESWKEKSPKKSWKEFEKNSRRESEKRSEMELLRSWGGFERRAGRNSKCLPRQAVEGG